ncbi:spirocyclase AveC family protein [Mycobacterium sp. M26]|uniref:spirocyclase AveC family protein n=1 Tax=Mycobacterium sp. M26 TaxID=1762962 RepID=UPI0018D23A01|nr:spirocyclase AveC family protein [Mycobacterium sp. M26]
MAQPMNLEGRSESPQVANRAGTVSIWAIVGVAWILFIGQAWTRWIASDTQFGPAPVFGPDRFDGAALLTLRVIEIVSLLIAAATIWVFLLKPLIATRRLTLDGMIVVGSLLASGIDPLINYFHYTFAWNAHAFNLGSWLAFFPLHQGPTRYAEGLAWFVPQYLYLGIGLAAIECRIIIALRRRYPAMPNVRSFAIAFAAILCLDVVLEQIFIRTRVYAFPRTWETLTLFAGTPYQFPVYESLFVAVYAAGFTALRMSAHDSPDGLPFLHRGAERWAPRLRTPIMLLATIGFCAVWAAVAYFIPWSWMSVNPDSIITPPSYMLPGPQ